MCVRPSGNGGRAKDWRRIRSRPSARLVTRRERNVSAGRRIRARWRATREDRRRSPATYQHGPRIHADQRALREEANWKCGKSRRREARQASPLYYNSIPTKNNHVSAMIWGGGGRFSLPAVLASHLIVLLIFVYQFLSVALAFVKESARMNTGPLAEIIFSPLHHISCGFIYSQERTNDEVFARPLG